MKSAFLKALACCAGVAALMYAAGLKPDWDMETALLIVALCTPAMTGFFLVWDRVFPLMFPPVPPTRKDAERQDNNPQTT